MPRQAANMPITAPVVVPDGPPPRRFPWFKRIAVGSLGVLLFVVGSWWAWDRHEAKRLAAEVERWRGTGFAPVSPRALASTVPDAVNGAGLLARAVEAVVPMERLPGSEQFGFQPEDAFYRLPWDPRLLDIARPTIERNRRAYELARAARLAPVVRWDLLASDGDPFNASPSWKVIGGGRGLADMIALRARACIQAGDDVGYFECLRDLYGVARVLADGTGVVPVAVAAGVDAMACRLTHSYARLLNLRSVDARARALEVAADMLVRGDPLAGFDRALAWEASHSIRQYQRPDAPQVYIVREGWRPAGVARRMVWRAMRPLRTSYAVGEAAAIRAALPAAHTDGWSASLAALPAPFVPRQLPLDPAQSIAESFHGRPFTLNAAFTMLYKRAADRQLAAASLACRVYVVDHNGEPPATLAELVPAYLPELPRDPFDPAGGPLRYVSATPRPFLYSLYTSSTDAIAAGTFVMTLNNQMNWNGPYLICFLDAVSPWPPSVNIPLPAPATSPAKE